LKAGIARGRSCASILIIPRRKMSLSIMGSSPERLKREKERGERARLGGGMEVAALERAAGHLLGLLCSCVLSVPLLQFAAFVLLLREKKKTA
jgi:hypothetical protein